MALAVVSVALLLALSVVWQERAIRSRVRAQAFALRAAEAAVESVRAGALRLESAQHPAPWEVPDDLGISDLVLAVEVEPQSVDDLYALRVEARYVRVGRLEVRRIETFHWRAD